MSESTPASKPPVSLSGPQCLLILAIAFLGWLFAGVHMSINGIVMRVGLTELMPGAPEGKIGQWFGFLICAFLFGAAAGGYLFGLLGDRIGRAKAMAASILCYSPFSGATYFASSAEMLLVLRFLTCLGIGGMWPNGIALVSEAWPNISRPILAGAIGTAANVGIMLFAILTINVYVTIDAWRWTLLVGMSPLIIGIFAWFLVPESPRWLALRDAEPEEKDGAASRPGRAGMGEVFSPPLLKTTLIGIALGTIPLFGGWGVANWANAWASEYGDIKKAAVKPEAKTPPDADNSGTDDKVAASTAKPATPPAKAKISDPSLKSWTTLYRSLPGSVSSLLGGALAFALGRKRTYFVLCLCALICTQFLFRLPDPTDPAFMWWTSGLGFFSGFFFGWLPLCLPEMFPTRVRSTGAGVSFNFGRIITAFGVLLSAYALRAMFQGQYAQVGQICGFIYAVGMVVIWFAPDPDEQSLES